METLFMELYSDDVEKPLSPLAQNLGKGILSTLETFYPAHIWRVIISERGGVVQVTLPAIPSKQGFILHTADIDTEMRSVMRAGGELLERYAISRDKTITTDNVTADLAMRKRDSSGQIQAEM